MVSTYKGRFSGISGYLEGDPAEHFMVELREETSLVPSDYVLLRRAQPEEIPDEEHGCLWQVHPFLCEVADPSKILLDWENTELEWVLPEEIKRLDTVPGLWGVYEKVSRLPLERAVFQFEEQLCLDLGSGAREMATAALEFLLRVCEGTNAASCTTLVEDLSFVCERIRNVRPSMAGISTVLDLVLREIHTVRSPDASAAIEAVSRIIGRHRQDMESSSQTYTLTGHLPGTSSGSFSNTA